MPPACAVSVVGGRSVAAGAAVLRTDTGLIACRIEGIHREFDAAEDVAWALGTAYIAGLGADLCGDAVVERRDQKLGVTLQSHDGELSDGHKEPAALAGEHQLIIEPLQHALRQFGQFTAATAAVAAVHHIGAEHHGIDYFHHGMRHATGRAVLAAVLVGEDLGVAVAAEEQSTLGEHSKAIYRHRAVAACGHICHYAVVEGDVQGVEAVVVGYGLYIDIGVDQLHTSCLCIGAAVQDPLTVTG